MKNFFGIAVLIVAIIIAVTAYNESAASKIYAQGQAESMIIRATSQAQQAALSVMFPYFILGLGFLALILVLGVWIVLSENRNKVLADKPLVERHYIESQTIVLLGKPQDRKEFYRGLQLLERPEPVPARQQIQTR